MQPGYYRLTRPFADEDSPGKPWEVGQLWYLTHIEGDQAHIIQGNSGWTMDADEFVKNFEYAPHGVLERQHKMSDLVAGLHDIGERQDQLLVSSSETPTLPDPSTSTDLIAAGGEQIAHVGAQIKKTKAQMGRMKLQIARRQKELQLYLREQEMILAQKVDALTQQMELASEAIYILNAYLGKDEELVRIKQGERAPSDTKIVIRQLILYMDEESAAAENWASDGGMDFTNVKDFDRWVVEHLDQVIPDPKGIVAIKPRRKEKHYSDNPFENAELNRANKCLYLLVRNGELVYRIYTNLWLEDVLFPRRDEFEEFFYRRDYDWDSHKTIKKPLHPGGQEYMDAMKKASRHRRRFYAALLLIQGILDRTKILQPLPIEGRLNVCDLHESTKYCTFLSDAEGLLGDGRPSFDDWLADVNGRLELGCRVVGNFRGHHHDCYHASDGRTSPKGAYNPDDNHLYVLERKIDKGFKFYYQRTEDRLYSGWDDWRGHEPKNRASYTVYRSDKFVLNFDAVDVAEMEYYMGHRTHRHNYLSMLPLLQVACDMKDQEAVEEESFRKLLIAQISEAHDVSLQTADDHIDELVHWWKFKCRTHRALTSEDAKALRMIVSEFGRRHELERQQRELAGQQQLVAKGLLEDAPQTLAIFHRGSKDYVVYHWENNEDVFVREEHWKEGDELVCVKSVAWKTVDARYQSWQLVWQHERWSGWIIGARALEHLTDEEREDAIEIALIALRSRDKEALLSWNEKERKGLWLAPLAAVLADDSKVYVYYLKFHAQLPKKNLFSNDIEGPSVGEVQVQWTKKRTGISYQLSNRSSTFICKNFGEKTPWASKQILFAFDKNIQAAQLELDRAAVLEQQLEEMLGSVEAVECQVFDRAKELWYAAQHQAFLEEYLNDEGGTLWEDYKEELSAPQLWPYWVKGAAGRLVERGDTIDGLTVREMLKRAKRYGFDFSGDRCEESLMDLILDISYKDE